MDINELESFRLSDAVKFNDTLNPRIWGSDEKMRPEVREKLLAIADDFREFLGITDFNIKDITVSGSNAAFTYTPHSDIDLHLVVDLPKADISEVYRELFNAKKYQYNDQHDYKIGPYDVELYVQNANEPHHSQGIYSIKDDDWVRVPVRRKTTVDDISVKSKYEDIGNRIDQAIASGNKDQLDAISKRVKDMRQSGLESTGEFGPENLAFKVLRGNGTLDKLRQARQVAKDKQFSLDEEQKTKKIYGYKNYWFPGYDYYTDLSQNVDQPSDINESKQVKFKDGRTMPLDTVVNHFVKFVAKHLYLRSLPTIKLITEPGFGSEQETMGHYMDDQRTIEVETNGRHIIDILRTLAHELVHYGQHRREEMPDTAGDTGSPWENEAHAVAGVLMRYFDRDHPEYFDTEVTDEVGETSLSTMRDYYAGDKEAKDPTELAKIRDYYDKHTSTGNIKTHRFNSTASYLQWLERNKKAKKEIAEATGYIPVNDQEARDPRYSMAITCDIQPGEVQRQARKMGFKTNAAGIPPTLKTSGQLQESLAQEIERISKGVQAGK